MSQQDNRFAWGNISRSQGKVGLAFEDVIDTRYPESFPITFERDAAVAQNGNAVGLKNRDDMSRVGNHIMIPKNGQTT
jgi:hypothetical protein